MVEILETRDKALALKLLIVEDDPASLRLMTEVFTSLKAEVCPMHDSQEAAQLVNREKFDGIFLDLQMPDVPGMELTQAVRRSSWNKSTPIIVVSGRNDRNAMPMAFATGATFFLQKPVDRQKLTTLFRSVRGTLFENRRRYTRVPLQVEVVCIVGPRALRGRSWNLSQGGMQLETGTLALGDSVKLSFRLPGATAMMDVGGVVAWIQEDRHGIQFTRISSQNEKEIRNFIARAEKFN